MTTVIVANIPAVTLQCRYYIQLSTMNTHKHTTSHIAHSPGIVLVGLLMPTLIVLDLETSADCLLPS